MKRLTGEEIPTTDIAFYRDDMGRLHMEIQGEHTNPVIRYNTALLTRAYPGSSAQPIHSAGFGGGGSSGYSGQGVVGGAGGCASGSSGSGGACDVRGGAGGGAGSGQAGYGGYSPDFNVPNGITDLKVVVNDVEADIKL